MRKGPIVLVVVVAVSAAIVAWFIQPRGEADALPQPAPTETLAQKSTDEAPTEVSASPPDEAFQNFMQPPANLEVYLPARLAEAASGSADAAFEMFQLTWVCEPPRYPRSEADVLRELEAVRSYTGQTVDHDKVLEGLAQQREHCEQISQRALPGHLHWLELAAEHGHPEAMVGYWHFHQVDNALHPDRYDVARLESVRQNAIAYLESARDAGVADAFSTIGAGQAGLLGSTPFERDDVEGLAHLYAAGRVDPAEGARWAESGFIRTVELRVPAYALAEARDRAEELIRDCCR